MEESKSFLLQEKDKSFLVKGINKSILVDKTLEKITKNSILKVDEQKFREYNEEIAKIKMERALKRYDVMIERAKIMNKYPDLIPYFIPIITREREEENQ